MITNNFNLPDPIYQAIANRQKPDVRPADIYTTALIDSPQIRVLKKKYRDQITEDASDMIWLLLGQCTHEILEKACVSGLFEEVLTADYPPYTVGAIIDHYEDGVHSDYKITSVWSSIYDRGYYEKQLNVASDILIRNGHPVEKHQNILILRDWNKNEAAKNNSYPKSQVVVKEQKLWTPEQRELYIRGRLEKHFGSGPDRQYECNDEDRWYTGTKYAVKHKDQKNAKKTGTKEECEQWIKDYIKNDKNKLYIEERPGENKRCERYCQVAEFCPQFKRAKDAA